MTAYNIANEAHGVRLQGYNAQKASFTTTIVVKQIGHAVYHIDSFDEDYLITLPSLHIENLMLGSPFVELDKSTTITSSSGYVSKIDYAGRGWVTGKKNSFTATLSKIGSEKKPLYTVEGQWNDVFTIHEGSSKKGPTIDTWSSSANKVTPLTVAPIEEQDPRESRRAWEKVVQAIKKQKMDMTSLEKSKIENAQRDLRKTEQKEGKEWKRTFFSQVSSDPMLDKLAQVTGELVEADKTGGIWRFDKDKAATATKPYDPAF